MQSLIDEGRITEEESRTHPHRNLILRAVDGVHETDPDLFYIELAPGDRLLLCSDGASGVLDQDRLADILGTGSIDYAVVELIRASLEAGSTDNITCVVADVVDPQARADDGHAAGGDPAGPMLVGAAAEQPRRAGRPKGFFRGHRSGDTGEIEPVPGEDGGGRRGPRGAALRATGPPPRAAGCDGSPCSVLLVAVLAGAGLLGYRWSQDQYYVAAHGDTVAICRGVQADIPGLTLTRVAEEHRRDDRLAAGVPHRAGRRRHPRDVAGRRPPASSPGSPGWPGSAPARPPARPQPVRQPVRQPGGHPLRRGHRHLPTHSGPHSRPDHRPDAVPVTVAGAAAPRLHRGDPMSALDPRHGRADLHAPPPPRGRAVPARC